MMFKRPVRFFLAAAMVPLAAAFLSACGGDDVDPVAEAASPTTADAAASREVTPPGDGDGFLLVSDTAAETLYVFDLPEMVQTDSLEMKLGAHGGVVTLSDGRVLFHDEKAGAFVALTIDDKGEANVAGSAPMPNVSWA